MNACLLFIILFLLKKIFWPVASKKIKHFTIDSYVINYNYNNDTIIENKQINVFYQFFITSNYERNEEIRLCLLKNKNNPFINKIYLMNEKIYSNEELGCVSSKIVQININKRLTYADIFTFIRKNNIKGYILINNADIFYDDTLKNLYMSNIDKNKAIFAQLRFEYIDNNTIKIQYNNYSQDSWIIHSNFIETIINNIKLFKFKLGMIRCDNHIAYLFCILGFNIINDPFFIKTYHYHNTNLRTYQEKDMINNHILYINPVKSKQFNIETKNN